MVTIKFNALKDNPKKIVFCIIDNIDEYPSGWIKELVKNSIDFEIGTITGKGFDVIVGFDEDDLLRTSAESYDYAVVSTCGTVWADRLDFFDLLESVCDEHMFIEGHILDKKEAYYELHPQCYIINLEKYRELNYPQIGNQSLCDRHTQTIPLRSEENFHDDYTPLKISPGKVLQEYQHKCHGWNIISLGLNKGYDIAAFRKELRCSKKYLYPDNPVEIHNRLSEFYLETNVASRNWVNPFTTASDLNMGPPLPGKIKNFVTPANGIDWIHYLVHHGYDNHTRVRFTDYNLLSLEFMKELVSWNGIDYIDFLNEFGKRKSNFLGLPDNIWFGIKQDIENKWLEVIKKYDWINLWKSIQDSVTFEFRFKDYLHYEGPNGKDIDYWIDDSFNDPCTLINLNHVFSYHSTGVFYSLRYRIDMENYTLKKLKEKVPEAHVFFDHRAWKGFKPYSDRSLSGQAKDIELLNINELTVPSWHYNNDWR